MDRLLRPKIFETEPTASNAEKLYKHWKMTFQNYLENSLTQVTPGTPGDEASLATEQTQIANNERKKKHALFNNISADVFELVSDCETFDAALAILDTTYIRPTSVVYSRHQLLTCKQEGKSVDSFKQDLERIAKSCNFQAVTADENRNQYIRDAFISGLSSSNIRQRLLENVGDLSITDAFSQARALEQAQNHSSAYETHGIAAVNDPEVTQPTPQPRDNDSDSLAATGGQGSKVNKNNKHEKCFFCGNLRHPRTSCPAKDSECNSCKKKGHWSRVCRSGPTLPIGAVGGPPTSPTLA